MSSEPTATVRWIRRMCSIIVTFTMAVALMMSGLVACGGGSEAVEVLSSPTSSDSRPAPTTPTETIAIPGRETPALPTETTDAPTSPTTVGESTPPTSTSTPDASATPRVHPPATAEPTVSPAAIGDAPIIVLDPGHDRTTPGALGIEYQVVLRTAFLAEASLEAAGYEVYLTRTDNEMVFVDDLALLPENVADFHPGYSHAYAHASKALSFDPDLVIVLHYNGHSNPDVAGIEVYYCENGGEQNLVLGEIVRDELLAALRSVGYEPPSARVIEDIAVARGNRHFPSLGNVYEAPITFIRNRYADAGVAVVLTEPLYMTNATELALIEDEATHLAIADAYVRAVDRYFGR